MRSWSKIATGTNLAVSLVVEIPAKRDRIDTPAIALTVEAETASMSLIITVGGMIAIEAAAIGILEEITIEMIQDVEIIPVTETIHTAGGTGERTRIVEMILITVVIQVDAMIAAGTTIEMSPEGLVTVMTGPVGPTAATGATTATGMKAVAAINVTVRTGVVATIGMSQIDEGHKPVEATMTTAWAILIKMKWTQSSTWCFPHWGFRILTAESQKTNSRLC